LQPISRRSFLAASAAIPISAAAAELTAKTNSVSRSVAGGAAYFDKATRLTISMWDFSWLMASHPGGAYADLERRVAEAAERGYNTLRVDCFPSRVLKPESRFEKNWSPGVDLPQWGQRAEAFSCNVRQKVALLANCCRKHGLWLGLDSWDKGHMFGHPSSSLNGEVPKIAAAEEERQFTRYGETWARALKLLREDGVLERAVWIAPMNEVPHFGGGHLAALADIRTQPQREGETKLTQSQREDDVYRRINHWMAQPIKAEVARDRIPISYSSLGAENYAGRLTDLYDVVDVHFMPGVITDAEDQRAFEKAGKGAPGGRFAELQKYDLKAFSSAWDQACRRHYSAMLRRTRSYHQSALTRLRLPSGKELAAIITESFGPCFWPDYPDVSWEWYKRYNADSLRVVAALDFKGSSLSNYAEPIFSLWKDVDWHWTTNTYFLAAG
jgi:hypothetical protein